jgi:putative transposase
MAYDPKIHHRRSIRLRGYDYAQPGAYFITLCAQHHARLFGEISDGVMRLNRFGVIVREEWEKTSIIREEILLDEFVVMPDHMHGIVVIRDVGVYGVVGADRVVGADGSPPLLFVREDRLVLTDSRPPLYRMPRTVGSLVAGFKSASTKRINIIRGTPGDPVWQRNYYEHIVRDEKDMVRIRKYIHNNPSAWNMDRK